MAENGPSEEAQDVAQPSMQLVALMLCDQCLDGAGGECHEPGCAMWMNRAPDLPLRDKIVARLTLEPVDGLSSPEGET